MIVSRCLFRCCSLRPWARQDPTWISLFGVKPSQRATLQSVGEWLLTVILLKCRFVCNSCKAHEGNCHTVRECCVLQADGFVPHGASFRGRHSSDIVTYHCSEESRSVSFQDCLLLYDWRSVTIWLKGSPIATELPLQELPCLSNEHYVVYFEKP